MFLTGAANHLPVHPFPTRRSSDLERATRNPTRGRPDRRLLPPRPAAALVIRAGAAAGRGGSNRRSRSEENTSEPPSQSNLVCRLLPEKKKMHLESILNGL